MENMPHYRCYILNGYGTIVSVDSVEADDDALAISLAGGLLRERHSAFAAIEIWHQKRMVGRIDNTTTNASRLDSLLKVPKPATRTSDD